MGGAAGTDIPISASTATSLAQTLGGNTTIQFGNGVLDNPQDQYQTPTTSATSAQGNAASQTGSSLPQFAAGGPSTSGSATGMASDNQIILDVALVGLGVLAVVLITRKFSRS
jgi:hypothetical protein